MSAGLISYEDFEKVQMRVGRIIEVEDFPKARKPAYKLFIDFGEFGIKTSSAQLTVHYQKENLLNRLIVAVTNFPMKQVAGFHSEVLVLGVAAADGGVILLEVSADVPLGAQVF